MNVADYCVLWGETAVAKTLPKLNFWNGQFTCNFSTRDQQAWDNFNPSQLSNNHLVAADEYLRKKISKISIGDQIRIRGKLVEYQNLNTGGTRGTSITRDDTGDGACETIFVEQVQILKTYTSMWRWLMYVSLLVFILSLLLYLKAPHRSRDN
ncbi:MAG: hypothetical protein KJO88_10085 [Gammaproteobacteria bacterium]|nr:hypothetical protein [Gammaproteobacteria bacterium]